MFWDRKHGTMGNSQRRAKGRHKTKGATGKAHTHVPVSQLDVCTDLLARAFTHMHSPQCHRFIWLSLQVLRMSSCVCACERISVSVTGFKWLISVAALVRVTVGFETTVRPLVITVSSLKPLALSSLYPKRERERTGTDQRSGKPWELCSPTQRTAGVREDQREWRTK